MNLSSRPLLDELRAYKRSRALAVAFKLGVLELARQRPARIEELAIECNVDAEWACSLLAILGDLDLVRYDGEQYELTPAGLLACDDEVSIAFAAYHFYCYEAWVELPERVRSSGAATGFHERKIIDPAFAEAYLRAMDVIAKRNTAFLGDRCSLRRRILDVGAGPSTFCRHLATNDAGITVTALDLPPIVSAAQRMFAYPSNYIWVASDYLSYCPDARFDAIFCSHVLEYCPQKLLVNWIGKCRQLLQPGGVAAFVVFLKEEGKNHNELNLFELSTGVNGTQLGHVCTVEEFRLVLSESGATRIECVPLPAGASYSEYLVTVAWAS
ncbi:MAG: methyltransferase domain-containing protein [Planctomycetaceae bacterium]|nr:methyltransferase domain-containing protein [Planctomycetaceae bacterium]